MRHTHTLLLFFLVFGIYLFTLHSTISPYRDSGDMITASNTLGIAHPPGYPLYVLVNKIFTIIIPWANTAYRINLSSAVFGAGAVLCLGLCLKYLSGNSIYAVLSLLFLVFSESFWRLSLVSEMYSLNAFLCGLVILCTVKLNHDKEKQNPAFLFILSYILGIGAGNHQTIIFLFPGLVWYIWRLGVFKPSQIVYAAVFFAVGMTIYLFLPLRSQTVPLSDWGSPKTLHNLLRVVTRSDYGGMRLHPEQSQFLWTASGIIGHLGVYVKSLISQFTILGFIIGLWGLFIKRKDRIFKFLFISLLISGPAFIILSNLPPAEKTTLPILEPHLVMPNLIFVLFVCAGTHNLSLRFTGKILIPAALLISFFVHLPLCYYRDHFFAYDYGKNLLAGAEKGSLFYDPDDPTAFITSYLQVVEGKREDVKLMAYFRTRWGYELLKKKYPEILPQREILSGQELSKVILDYNRKKYPIYAELPAKFPPGYNSYPTGLLYKLSKAREHEPSGVKFSLYGAHNETKKKGEYDFFTNQVISYYAASHNNLGLEYARQKKYESAKSEYFTAIGIDPELDASYNNIGTLEYFQKNFLDSEKWFRQVLKLSPENPSSLYNLGLSYKAQNKTALACEFFQRAWDKSFYPDAGNELGLIALNSGDISSSIEMFRSIIDRYPGYLSAYYNLGLAYQKLSDFENSRRYFEIYLSNVQDINEKKEISALLNTFPKR